jgi:myo-inositol-1(or 4)-monophosphatase
VTEALDIKSDLDADLALLRLAAAEAGRIAMGYFRRDPKVMWKAGMSPVTEADLHADAYLRETLLAARPDYGWLSEETADTPERLSRRRTFVVDPIDGTKAFIDGRDMWCVSVAIVEDGKSLAGVLDCPARAEVFEAQSGRGSRLNGLNLGLNVPGEQPRIAGAKAFLNAYEGVTGQKPEHMHHIPSLAYRVAIIAAGRMDATFIKPNAHDWDLAAAALILSEAGGELLRADGTTPEYARLDTTHGVLVAGHKSMTASMLGVVAQSSIG